MAEFLGELSLTIFHFSLTIFNSWLNWCDINRIQDVNFIQQPPIPLPTGRYVIDLWYSCHLRESLHFSRTDSRTYLSILIAHRLRMLAVHIMTSKVTKMSQWILLKRHSPTTCNIDTIIYTKSVLKRQVQLFTEVNMKNTCRINKLIIKFIEFTGRNSKLNTNFVLSSGTLLLKC